MLLAQLETGNKSHMTRKPTQKEASDSVVLCELIVKVIAGANVIFVIVLLFHNIS